MDVVESRPDLYQRTLGMRGMSEIFLQRKVRNLDKVDEYSLWQDAQNNKTYRRWI